MGVVYDRAAQAWGLRVQRDAGCLKGAGPVAEPEGLVKAKESPESAAKRVDGAAKSDVIGTDGTAAKKPLFQTVDTANLGDAAAADSTEASYFPAQVALNVGGSGGGYRQQSWHPQQDSVKAFDLSQSASLEQAAPAPPPPDAATPAVLRSSTSSRQLQPLPQQQQLQLQQLQQQPSSRVLPSLQGQPLTESGPEPASTSSPLAAQPAAAAAPSADDPWSSLQSTYRIRDPQQAAKVESTRSREASSSRDAGREVLVLGEDDDDEFGKARGGTLNSTANSAMNRTSGFGARPPVNLPPPQFGSGPKKGGWGSGAMAQAGELMIGEDDWLVNDRPPGSATGSGKLPAPQRQQQQQQQAVLSYNSRAKMVVEEEERHAPVTLKGPAPPPKNKAAEDVMCEDVEDVDMLLESEMERQGLSNKSLASKLAAYEAQFKDEDDY
ncbi:hypothetical protein VOLCADRAFT_121492 [Volvox carteri f. nagariensis]|uniref:Uncharacterized protein n=1 Tax=Volvox carteri f. nagariensis TaxID=3068 RepID=D8UBW8_VOLCA|nr:uncharacterized protein VOLCADRAFT_121492 [Volvox carteri f. nagariensis]EFJ42692.1 hypothetical protein VOLCADRAFT_121492 [Volvox carteri f. nagariensis]|eukprot:XP_002956153.1 hypothetical protein VOLCADRAFT_121492 [Volvox carteri f. nagariensis]